CLADVIGQVRGESCFWRSESTGAHRTTSKRTLIPEKPRSMVGKPYASIQRAPRQGDGGPGNSHDSFHHDPARDLRLSEHILRAMDGNAHDRKSAHKAV